MVALNNFIYILVANKYDENNICFIIFQSSYRTKGEFCHRRANDISVLL